MWGDEDECFNLKLENFGVEIDTRNDTPTCLKRVICCCIKTWEEPLLKDNKAVTKSRLLRKYSGLVYTDDAEPFEIFAISQDKTHYKPFGGGGLCVIGEINKYKGENDDVLQPHSNQQRAYTFPRCKNRPATTVEF